MLPRHTSPGADARWQLAGSRVGAEVPWDEPMAEGPSTFPGQGKLRHTQPHAPGKPMPETGLGPLGFPHPGLQLQLPGREKGIYLNFFNTQNMFALALG